MDELKNIKLIVMDVDGTLTDGSIYYSSQGDEMKCFHVKDGVGIMAAHHAGIECMILTGRKSRMVQKRAEELKIKYIFQDVTDKRRVLKDFMEENAIGPEQIAYIGDDDNDYFAMKLANVRVCPKDASGEIKKICNVRLTRNGGTGAVREFIDMVLEENNRWENCIQNMFLEDGYEKKDCGDGSG